MPLLHGLPSGGWGTNVEGAGGRQLDSHVGFVPKPTVRLLDRMSAGGSLLWVPASGGVCPQGACCIRKAPSSPTAVLSIESIMLTCNNQALDALFCR